MNKIFKLWCEKICNILTILFKGTELMLTFFGQGTDHQILVNIYAGCWKGKHWCVNLAFFHRNRMGCIFIRWSVSWRSVSLTTLSLYNKPKCFKCRAKYGVRNTFHISPLFWKYSILLTYLLYKTMKGKSF